MLIDKGQYYYIQVDDVDEIQSDVKMLNSWSDTAADQLKVAVDKDVIQGIYDDAHASNKGGSAGADSAVYNLGASGAPVALTKVNITDYITDIGTVLEEQDIPDSERWIVLPPVFTNLIPKSDLKDVSLTGDKVSPLRNGKLGEIANMRIYVSRQLYSTTDSTGAKVWYCLAGHPIAVSFATQLSKTESIRTEHAFASRIRGLEVYGYKTVKTSGLACLYARVG